MSATPPLVTAEVGETLSNIQRKFILATVKFNGGNKRKTAEMLSVSLKTVYNKLKAYKR